MHKATGVTPSGPPEVATSIGAALVRELQGARERRVARELRSLEAESAEVFKVEELRAEHAARGVLPTEEELELEASIQDAKPLVAAVQRHPPGRPATPPIPLDWSGNEDIVPPAAKTAKRVPKKSPGLASPGHSAKTSRKPAAAAAKLPSSSDANMVADKKAEVKRQKQAMRLANAEERTRQSNAELRNETQLMGRMRARRQEASFWRRSTGVSERQSTLTSLHTVQQLQQNNALRHGRSRRVWRHTKP